MGRRCDTYAKRRYVQQTQHEQLGNAVPPRLAQCIARSIRRQLMQGYDNDRTTEAVQRFHKIFVDLDSAYPQDNLRNKVNPLDELVFIVLSRRTREAQYQRAYNELRKLCRPWSKFLSTPEKTLRKVLQPRGLVNQRVATLRAVFSTIIQDFGSLTLAPLKRMSYSEAYHYLRSLPGVNDKTAKCVMLYSLSLPALPVDTHTLRVSKRLGLLPSGTSLFKAPRALDAVVPRASRGRFHVLTVLHGREVCTPKDPDCGRCPVKLQCPTGLLKPRSDARRKPA
jgi:endonuclease III